MNQLEPSNRESDPEIAGEVGGCGHDSSPFMQTSLPSIRTTTWVEQVRSAFLGLSRSSPLALEIQKILEHQFQDLDRGELGGKIIAVMDGISLEEVWPVMREIHRAALIGLRERNDPESAGILGECVRNYMARFELSDIRFTVADLTLDCISKGKLNDAVLEGKAAIIPLLERLVRGSYVIHPEDKLTTDPNFRGIFHVHYNGTGPSIGDIATSRLVTYPNLILSATNDFMQSGTSIYLIHAGTTERVFAGQID